MFVGVKNPSASPAFSGLYYQAGMDLDVSDIVDDNTTPDSYYGSLVAITGGTIVGHQRINDIFNGPYDYTYNDAFTFNKDGSVDDPYTSQHYVFSGAYRVGVGNSPFLGFTVAIGAPPFSGQGVYLNPTGVQNAASSALFTAGISPGEIITLSGTNLAKSNAGTPTLTLPPTLAGVQVMMNGYPAPLVYVTSGLIAAEVPFEAIPSAATAPIVQIQVINSLGSSKVITVFTSDVAPGVYTIPAGGLGASAMNHISTYTAVTDANPAQIGEPVFGYVNGLGNVNPPIGDGVPASGTVLSTTTNVIEEIVDGVAACASAPTPCAGQFAGLAPTFAGLYQLNFTIPSGVSSGDVYLDLEALDPTGSYVTAYSSEATIAVGGGGLSSSTQAEDAAARKTAIRHRPAFNKNRSLKNSKKAKGRVVPR